MDVRYGVQRPPSSPCPRALKLYRYVQPHPRNVGSADVVLFFRRSSRMKRVLTMLLQLSLCVKRWRCSAHRRQSPCRPLFRPNFDFKSQTTCCTPHTDFIFDTLLILYSELGAIRTNTAKWTKTEKTLPRRLLDAQRVATELKGVMVKICHTNERFIVRSFYQRDGTAPLISTLDGGHFQEGCQGKLSSMTCTSLTAHDDDRINVRRTDFQLGFRLTYFT
jgi:hypothetical protein